MLETCQESCSSAGYDVVRLSGKRCSIHEAGFWWIGVSLCKHVFTRGFSKPRFLTKDSGRALWGRTFNESASGECPLPTADCSLPLRWSKRRPGRSRKLRLPKSAANVPPGAGPRKHISWRSQEFPKVARQNKEFSRNNRQCGH